MSIKVNSIGGLIGLALLVPLWLWGLPIIYRTIPEKPEADFLRFTLLIGGAVFSWMLVDRLVRRYPGKLWPKSFDETRQKLTETVGLRLKWLAVPLVLAILVVSLCVGGQRSSEWSGTMARIRGEDAFAQRFGVCLCWIPTGCRKTRFNDGSQRTWQKQWTFLVVGRRDFGLWSEWETGLGE